MRTTLDLWTNVGARGVDLRATDGRSSVLVDLSHVELDGTAAGNPFVDELVAAMTKAAQQVLESAGGVTA